MNIYWDYFTDYAAEHIKVSAYSDDSNNHTFSHEIETKTMKDNFAMVMDTQQNVTYTFIPPKNLQQVIFY